MPESRALHKMVGLEQEYGCYQRGSQSSRMAGRTFFQRFRSEWLEGSQLPSSQWDASERTRYQDGAHRFFKDQNWCMANYLLPNGARYYLDDSHPEYCIPLCRTAREAVMYDKAGEIIMDRISKKIETEEDLHFRLIKNNAANGDSGTLDLEGEWLGGVSYSTHENYLVRRDVALDDLISRTLPFFIFRTLMFGGGKVGGQSYTPWVDFQMSQRADFFKQPLAQGTMGHFRGIYNLRDCPYGDPSRFRRLHVIPGDANMCEVSGFLKLVTTRILLMMIEDGAIDQRFETLQDWKTFHAVSRDLTMSERYLLKNRRQSRRALDILKEYAELFGEYLEHYAIRDPELISGTELFSDVVEKLDRDPDSCIGAVDWVTKRFLISQHLSKKGIDSWTHPHAGTLDAFYHYVRKEESMFYRSGMQKLIAERGYKIIPDDEIERAMITPPDTRSRFQVEVLKRLHVTEWNWRIMHLRDPEDELFIMVLDDPSASWEFFSGLLDDDPAVFFNNCRQAGLIIGSRAEAVRVQRDNYQLLDYDESSYLRKYRERFFNKLTSDNDDDKH